MAANASSSGMRAARPARAATLLPSHNVCTQSALGTLGDGDHVGQQPFEARRFVLGFA